MAKNNHTLGKLLAFTTAIAAVGGACYIYRDKIRQSAIYQKAKDKLSGLTGGNADDDTDDDFFFDDEDSFAEDNSGDREYTSIAINTKQEDEDTALSPLPQEQTEESDNNGLYSSEEPEPAATQKEEDSIPTISFGGGFSAPVSTPEPPTVTQTPQAEAATDTVNEYEYEGLSDVSEDPDVLEEQDKLDF